MLSPRVNAVPSVAIAGYPSITLPMGLAKGMPVGMTVVAPRHAARHLHVHQAVLQPVAPHQLADDEAQRRPRHRPVDAKLAQGAVEPVEMRPLVDQLFRDVPTGVGRSGHYSFKGKELTRLLGEGSSYLISRGLATQGDIDHTEAKGYLDGADPDSVSDHAKMRGQEQCGTLGSGNHFLEVQIVEAILDAEAAEVMGLKKDQVCVMIHSGSRGLGYQVCDDALAMFRNVPAKYGIELPDRQLACAPVDSAEGQQIGRAHV